MQAIVVLFLLLAKVVAQQNLRGCNLIARRLNIDTFDRRCNRDNGSITADVLREEGMVTRNDGEQLQIRTNESINRLVVRTTARLGD